jgi:NADH-quinone oxidoreductase subunit N
MWFTILAVAGAVNAAIAAAYYLRIVAVMFFQEPNEPVAAAGGRTARFAAVLCAGLVLAIGAWPASVFDVAVQSETMLRPQARTMQSPPASETTQLVQGQLQP